MANATSSSIGVLAAPGVRVTRFDPRKAIELGPLGVVGYAGILEKGPIEEGETIGSLIGPLEGPTPFEKICGGRIPESELPRVCQDFFSHGGNRLYLVRVADGTQESSVAHFRNRRDAVNNGMDKRCIKIMAHNPGRWGGRQRIRFGKVYFSTQVTGSSFGTGYSDPADAWKGGTLSASLGQVSSSWKILSNSSTGAVSTNADKSFTVDLQTSTGWRSHGDADTTRVTALTALVPLAAEALLAAVITRVNLLKTHYNNHVGTGGNVHKVADVANVASSDDAANQDGVNTLLNEIKDDLNLHFADTSYHNIAASTSPLITSADASDLPSSITLANEILADLLVHAGLHAYIEWSVVVASDKKRLSVEFTDGSRNFDNDFGIVVYMDGDPIYRKTDLSMDSTSGRYFVSVINNDPLNHYIRVEDEWNGEANSSARPANFWGYASFMDATTITIWPIDYFMITSAGADGNVGGWVFGNSMVRDRLTLTFKSPTTFDVESEAFGALPDGTVGELYTSHAQYGISFVVNAGDTAFAVDDEIDIDVEPLEVEYSSLSGFKVFTDTSNYPRVPQFIKRNTRTTISGRASDDYTDVGTPPAAPVVKGTIAGAGVDFTFDTSVKYTFRVKVDRGLAQEVEVTSGVETPLSTIIEDINEGISGLTTSAGTGDDEGMPVFTGNRGGKFAFIEILDGDLNDILGLQDNTEYSSEEFGSTIRVQGPYDLVRGSDGSAGVTDEMMEDVFDVTPGDKGSPFNQIEDNALVKFATPSWSSVSVQQAGRNYAKVYHHQFRLEIPPTIFDEHEAAEWVDSVFGREDGLFVKTSFPSYAYIPDPDGERGSRIYACLTGMIHGREAAIAMKRKSYHKAEAGLDASLPNVIALGDALEERPIPRNLDLEFLNPKGINGIRRIRGEHFIWGARTISTDPQWIFAHQAEQMAHYEHVLLGQFDWAVFEDNNEDLWDKIRGELDTFFSQEYAKGALRGERPEDAYTVKCDATTNPDASIEQGQAQAEVELRLPGTAEIVIIGISRKGINTTTK